VKGVVDRNDGAGYRHGDLGHRLDRLHRPEQLGRIEPVS
jgi:hypothetical protein